MKGKFLALILILVFLFSSVNALVQTYYPYYPEVAWVELRSEYDSYWDNSITANKGDAIDIRAQIYVNYDYYNYPYYDPVYDPYDRVQVWAEVYGDGIYLKQTSTKTYYINQLNYKNVEWNNGFYVDDRYDSYEVVVYARSAYDYSSEDWGSAFINTVNSGFDSYCSDIEIQNKIVAMNEDETETVTFIIENNSDERFSLWGAEIFGENFFQADYISKDSSIMVGRTGEVRFEFNTESISEDETDSATLEIEGEFYSGKYCPSIRENFLVKIQNEADQECRDIKIIASDERMQEDDTELFDFRVKNYSDTKFYIDSFDVYTSSSYFNATEFYKPHSILGNSEEEFSYKVSSEKVNSDKTGKIRIRISGHYSGGDHCSYSEIGEEVIDLTVEDDYWNGDGECKDLYLRTKTLNLDEDDSYSTSFSIENNSNKRFYVQDVELEENSSYLNFRNYDTDFTVYSNSDKTFNFTAETKNVSSDKIITSYFKVRGKFENGETCSFSDTRKSFTVRIDDTGYSSSACNEINVLTKTVFLKEGETKNFDFEIENNSNKRFYIGQVRVYDNDSGIESREYNSPSSISANNSGTITARITAKDSGDATAFIEVSGHYQNGRSCSASDIGRESFKVDVGGGETCSDFILDVPSAKSILGQEEITINVDNPTNKKGTIRLSGTNLSVSPHTIEIPRNYSTTKRIEVELLEGKESFLVYDVSLENCNIKSKTTKITSAITLFEVVNYPREKTIGLKDKISFTIKNNSGTSREFRISMQVPSQWKVNEKSIVIPGDSDRTASLSIEAEEGTYGVTLIVESAGKTIEKQIELTVTEEEKEIEISAETTAQLGNELELKVKINNQSEREIRGNLIIELPEEWSLEGNTSISVEPETEKEFSFKLKTDGKDLEQEIPVTLELDTGEKIDTKTEFKTTGLGTAFVSLAQNIGVAIGLIIIVIVVVILLVRK